MLHVIWDLDGTLIDSQQEVLFCLTQALQDAGFALSDLERPLRVGPTVDVMLKNAFPAGGLSDSSLAEIVSCFRRRYDNSDFSATEAFPGIGDIISRTDLFANHIVTNKPDYPTNRIIAKLGWTAFFQSVTTPYTHLGNSTALASQRKTKPELFADVIARYADAKSVFVGVGDMEPDCVAARKNGICAIGVLWGTGTRTELDSCADLVVESVVSLREKLVAMGTPS